MSAQERKTALITGGSSGIGQALSCQLAKENLHVYIVGRRAEKLFETQSLYSDHIFPIIADISTAEGRTHISDILGNTQLNYLIHNAATVDPLKTIEKITLEEWRQHSATNLEAPLFLTQLLIPNWAPLQKYILC